jgi:hypothetical protein
LPAPECVVDGVDVEVLGRDEPPHAAIPEEMRIAKSAAAAPRLPNPNREPPAGRQETMIRRRSRRIGGEVNKT